MTAKFYSPERYFTASCPSLTSDEAVFYVDDLTTDECLLLTEIVQNDIAELNRTMGRDAEHFFSITPSAEADPAAFAKWKMRWAHVKDDILNATPRPGGWVADLRMIYDIAVEAADVIRSMRVGKPETAYLQFGSSDYWTTFDCVDCLTMEELVILRNLLNVDEMLDEKGFEIRFVTSNDAANDPQGYIQARTRWTYMKSALEDSASEGESTSHVDEDTIHCRQASAEYIEEILLLRRIPKAAVSADEGDQEAGEIVTKSLLEPSEELKITYRDPENYDRNVWLYRMRKEGRTNAEILSALGDRAEQFAPLETENALRSAIDAIARHHSWPPLKGKSGRRKASELSDA